MSKNQIVKIGELLREKHDTITRVIPSGTVDPTEFLASVQLAFAADERGNLQQCLTTDSGRVSVINSLRMVASTGLSLNPQRGEAALVAYKGSCKYQIMKDGYVALAMRTGRVQYIAAEEVFKNDHFKMSKNMTGDTFEFNPDLDNRGPLRGFFAAILYQDDAGNQQGRVEWMTVGQMEEHRDQFRADKSNKNGPWSSNFAGMGRKTVLKRLLSKNKISDKIAAPIMDENENWKDTYEQDEPIAVEATVTTADAIAEEMQAEPAEPATVKDGKDLF